MVIPEPPSPPEPPLLERARRGGWLMLAVSLVVLGGWRFGGAGLWTLAVGIGFAIAGLLCVINVALVRGLYGELARRKGQPPRD